MTGNQKVLFNLFKELIDIFEENDILWFVSGRSALRCFEIGSPFYKSFLDLEVTIPIEKVNVLIDSINLKDNKRFVLEGLYNNNLFPGFYLKFVDTTTTLFCVNEGYSTREKGLYIRINFFKNYNVDSFDMARKIEEQLLNTSCSSIPKSKDAFYYFSVVKRRVLSESWGGNKFNELLELYGRNSNFITFDDIFGQYVVVNKKEILQLMYLDCDDITINIPSNQDLYANLICGRDWRNYIDDVVLEGKHANMIIPGANNLTSVKLPYSYLIKVFKSEGLTRKLLKKRELTSSYNVEHIILSQNSKSAWLNAQRAGDLIHIRDYYCDKIEYIKLLYNYGQIDELENVLYEYEFYIQKYLKENVSFYWNDTLLEIYLDLLRVYGKDDEVDRILRLKSNDIMIEKLLLNMPNMIGGR